MRQLGNSCPVIFVPPAGNLNGILGPVCPKCDGWGYLLGIKTGGPCSHCAGSGVRPLVKQLPEVKAYLDKVRYELEQVEKRARRIDPGLPDALNLRRVLDIKASRQLWQEQLWWATSSGTAVANTVTETILFPNVTIPANYLQDGRTLRIRSTGQHSTLGSGTVTLTFRLRWGGVSGTVIAITAAITQVISLTAAVWDLDIILQTRSNGSTGTVMCNGTVRVFGATAPTIGSATGAPAIAPMCNGGQTTPAVATLDLTADTALSLTVQHGAQSTSNTVTGLTYNGESLN